MPPNKIQPIEPIAFPKIEKQEILPIQPIDTFHLFGNVQSEIQTETLTIATTGNSDTYIICPYTGFLSSVDFSGVDALTTSDTNFITFTITNLGRGGGGTTAMLDSGDVNTTKVAGTAISANTVRELTLSGSLNATRVAKGERLRIRAAATGTLANTVTFATYLCRFK